MSSFDPELGDRVCLKLEQLGIHTPITGSGHLNKEGTIRQSHEQIMYALGLNMEDDSLKDTPKRVAKMYCQEIFTGLDYTKFPKCTTIINAMKMDEMIAVRKAEVLSVCEHHFVPFVGHAAVAYIPGNKVLGLSKINRIVDFFSRRPQVQERLTLQIYEALRLIVETDDIAVVIKAEHFCVRLRGVKQDSETITSKMGGRFMDNPALREEFLALTR